MKTIFTLSILLLITRVRLWCEHARIVDVGPVTSVDYSPDGTMLLTTTASRVTIWQRSTKQILFVKTISNAKYAKFSSDSPSTYIAISTANSDIQVISAASPFASLFTFNAGHGGALAAHIDVSPSNQLITCGGTNHKLRGWVITTTGTPGAVMSFDTSVTQIFTCAAMTATQMGTGASNNKLDLQTVTPFSTISSSFTKSLSGCNQIAFSPTSTAMIAACSSGGSSGVYITIATTAQVNIITTGAMLTVAYAKDGNTYCYGGNTKILYIVNATSANNTIISQFLENSVIEDSDFTNDGLYLVAGTQDGTVYEYAKYCLSCRPGYYTNLVAKTCVLCQTTMQGCAFCNSSTYCVQCYQNYIIDTVNHKCLSCAGLMQGCGTCLDSTSCRYCMPGYYMVTGNNTCARCQGVIKGCYTCNSSAFCIECQSDYYLDTTTNLCIGCEIGITNCIKCSSNTSCTSCKIGFYRNSGACTACPTNCYACQSSTNCTDCVTGYYAFSSGGTITCTKCATGCLACNATGYCKNCADDRYADGSGGCTQCSYPCVSCNASNYCLSCDIAYFYNGAGGCTQCSGGCISCNSSAMCLSCSPTYYLDTATSTCESCQLLLDHCMECTNNTCLKCQIGTYLFNSTCNNCSASMFACIVCSSATTCQFCAAGYYKTASSGNSSCQICTLGCATCVSNSNCSSCNVGYYLNAGAATCTACANSCITCSSATVCLQCQIGYRLGTSGSCVPCLTDIGGCQSCSYNYTAAGIWCLSCQLGRYLDTTTGACSYCSQNCTSCINSSYCLTCQVGMYRSGTNTCVACHHNCSQCIGSATNCSSCVAGYYVTGSYACMHCSAFGCATCNSTTHDCLSCQLGFYIKTVTGPPTKICDNCLTAISNCYICTSSTVCKQCGYGYALATNSASCTPCSVNEGCKHCTSLSSCQNCEIGYYLVVNGSGFGSCSKCSIGCKDCNQAGVCQVCFSEYSFENVSGVISCKLCENSLTGCTSCSSSTVCTACQSAYYLSSNQCALCSQPIFACKYCNSSTICTSCQDGYYLAASNLCQKCQTTMIGCVLCNSSSVCLSCEYGMYLNTNQCYRCTVNLPNCVYCLNLTTCLQCDTGSYLTTTGCLDCQAHISGCIQCNSNTSCLQCKGGYFLNSSTKLCQNCNQQGCEICIQSNPTGCVKCNSRFYFNSSLSTCIKCRTEIDGCLQCLNSTKCSKCDGGYYLNSTFQCNLCQSVMYGCGRCNSALSCLQCKSTYYLTGNNSCMECKLSMEGCSHCINSTACQSCYHGYYMDGSSLCVACTSINGCLSCLNSTYCQYCENSYFLQATQSLCYPCSALQGCYACTTNRTCSICAGGYILNDEQLCQVMRVQAHDTIKDLKLVTKYFNSTCLIHYLYAKDMTYNQSNGINWTKTTKLILQDSKYKQTALTILKVQWGTNEYTLIFYTNNPLELGANNFQFARRRLLLTGSVSGKYKVNLKMDQATINQILPEFYLPKDLIMNYDISSPEFVMSYANSTSAFLGYSIFGYVITTLFIIKYILKAAWSAPCSPEMGDIIPQVLALKAPAFMIYPSFLEFVYYCSGFMIPDFPWANQIFGKLFGDHSDTVVESFALFYVNMHIGSTYMLAIIVLMIVGFVMWLLYNSKDEGQKNQGFSMGNVMYNIFIFGATWAGCVSLQGALLNPIQSVNLNSGLYMVGIAVYCVIFGIAVYFFYKDRNNMDKIRIFIKASLLSAANISPIYIFCSSILVDIVLLLIQYNVTTYKKVLPKIWLIKNLLCNLSLCFLVFMPQYLLSLMIASFLVGLAFVLDVYTHGKEYKARVGKKKFRPDQQSSVDVNIWNINYEKSHGNYKLEEFNIEDQEQKSKDKQTEEFARKTGFASTHATFAQDDQSSKLQTKRRFRKIKNSEEKPEVIDVKNPKQREHNIFKEVEEQEQNGNTFVAQRYLS